MLQTVFCLSLFVFALATYDPTYIIYDYNNRLKGPFNSSVRTFGNFHLDERSVQRGIGFSDLQTALDTIMGYYGKEEFQRGSTYTLEHYYDTSLSVTAYILYRRVNVTHTFRYYAVETLIGKLNGTYFNMGSDTCQSCRPGKDMPLFKYQELDVTQNSNLVKAFLSVINSVQTSSALDRTAVSSVKYWQFPKGSLYLVFQTAPSSEQKVSTLLDQSGKYMSFINSAIIPHIEGNIPIDYVYVRKYIEWIKFEYKLSNTSGLIFFEYYLDEITRDSITFMVNFRLSNGKKGRYLKFIGVMPTYYKQYIHNDDIEVLYQKNFTQGQEPYMNISYFNNNKRDLRMGSTLQTPEQFNKMSIIATNGCSKNNATGFNDILKIFYIDFPDNKRLFNVYCECGTQIKHKYFQMEKDTLQHSRLDIFQRVLVANQSYNDNTDWIAAVQRIADYTFVYGMSYNIVLYRQTEYCDLYDKRFEIMVMHTTLNDPLLGSSSKKYCPRRVIFFKDLLTNRTLYIGITKSTIQDCDYNKMNYYVKSVCPLIRTDNLDMDWLEKIYSSLKDKLRNQAGDFFTIQQVQEFTKITTSSISSQAPDLYILTFNKSDFISTYIITMNQKGEFSIFDYFERIVEYPKLTGKKPSLNVNSTNSTTLSTQTNRTQSSNSTNSSFTNQTNPTTSNNTPSTTPSLPPFISFPSNHSNSSTTNIPSSKNIAGNSDLTLSDIQAIYANHLSDIIQSKDPSFRQQNPIIHYFSDNYNQLISYAILFSYPPSIFVVYEILHLKNTNTFYYVGKSFIPVLRSAFWELRPTKITELMQLSYKLINKTSSLQDDMTRNVSMNGISYIDGGYFMVDIQFASGNTLHASFLRHNNAWITVYGFLQPPPQDINKKTPSNNLPTLLLMTSDDVNNDQNIQQAFNQISGNIQQMTQPDGYVLNKIEKGKYMNGTLLYVLTYRNQMVTSYLIFQLFFDPATKKLLSAQYSYQKQTQGTPPQVSSATASQPSIQTLIQQKISQFSQSRHPQLKDSQFEAQIRMDSSFYYGTVVYTISKNNCKFKQSVRMSIADLKIEELTYAHL